GSKRSSRTGFGHPPARVGIRTKLDGLPTTGRAARFGTGGKRYARIRNSIASTRAARPLLSRTPRPQTASRRTVQHRISKKLDRVRPALSPCHNSFALVLAGP